MNNLSTFLSIYFIISQIFIIHWLCTHMKILDNNNLHILRRYFISTTVGLFVVIPFHISMIISKLLTIYSRKISRYGKKLSDEIRSKSRTASLDEVMIYYDRVKKYNEKCDKFRKLSYKYTEILNTSIKNKAKWLAQNYI